MKAGALCSGNGSSKNDCVMCDRGINAVHPKVLSSRLRILPVALSSVTPAQLQPVEVKLRRALMMSGLLLRQMFQEVLVKMSCWRGSG